LDKAKILVALLVVAVFWFVQSQMPDYTIPIITLPFVGPIELKPFEWMNQYALWVGALLTIIVFVVLNEKKRRNK